MKNFTNEKMKEKICADIILLTAKETKKPMGHVLRLTDFSGNESYFYRGRTFSKERTEALGAYKEVISSKIIEVNSEEFSIVNNSGKVSAICFPKYSFTNELVGKITYSKIETNNSQKNLGTVRDLPFLISEALCSALHNNIQVYKINGVALPVNQLEKLDMTLNKEN